MNQFRLTLNRQNENVRRMAVHPIHWLQDHACPTDPLNWYVIPEPAAAALNQMRTSPAEETDRCQPTHSSSMRKDQPYRKTYLCREQVCMGQQHRNMGSVLANCLCHFQAFSRRDASEIFQKGGWAHSKKWRWVCRFWSLASLLSSDGIHARKPFPIFSDGTLSPPQCAHL